MQGLCRVLRALGKSPSGQAPLLGMSSSWALWVSDSVMWGFAMRISVRGWKLGVDSLYVGKKLWNVCLRRSTISWPVVAEEPSG